MLFRVFKPVFLPGRHPTTKLTPGGSAVSAQLLSQGDAMLITNTGFVPACVRWGNESLQAATEGDLPIPPGAGLVVRRDGATHASAIGIGGSTVIYITVGDGA